MAVETSHRIAHAKPKAYRIKPFREMRPIATIDAQQANVYTQGNVRLRKIPAYDT
jgi:hypothetical protein